MNGWNEKEKGENDRIINWKVFRMKKKSVTIESKLEEIVVPKALLLLDMVFLVILLDKSMYISC